MLGPQLEGRYFRKPGYPPPKHFLWSPNSLQLGQRLQVLNLFDLVIIEVQFSKAVQLL